MTEDDIALDTLVGIREALCRIADSLEYQNELEQKLTEARRLGLYWQAEAERLMDNDNE